MEPNPINKPLTINQLSQKIIGCAISVHAQLGPGLLEKHYEIALCHELAKNNISYQQQYPVKVFYDGQVINKSYFLDLVVENTIILEIKCVQKLNSMHVKQLNSYLQITQLPMGLLLNFQELLLRNGLKRVVRNGVDSTEFSVNSIYSVNSKSSNS